jgi:hypothetical protein
MRSSRHIALLALAACLAVASLSAPLVWKGLTQKRIEEAIRAGGGDVMYLPHPANGGVQGLVAPLIGPQFLGDIVVLETLGIAAPSALNQVLDHAQGLPSLQVLNVRGEALDTAALEKIANLKAVTYVGIHEGALPDLSPLARSTSLANLYLESADLAPESLEQLAHVRGLTELSLGGSDIAGSSLAVFREFPALKTLNLVGTAVTTDDLAALAGAPALEAVVVSPGISGTASLEEIRSKMPGVSINTPVPMPAPVVSTAPASTP